MEQKFSNNSIDLQMLCEFFASKAAWPSVARAKVNLWNIARISRSKRKNSATFFSSFDTSQVG